MNDAGIELLNALLDEGACLDTIVDIAMVNRMNKADLDQWVVDNYERIPKPDQRQPV